MLHKRATAYLLVPQIHVVILAGYTVLFGHLVNVYYIILFVLIIQKVTNALCSILFTSFRSYMKHVQVSALQIGNISIFGGLKKLPLCCNKHYLRGRSTYCFTAVSISVRSHPKALPARFFLGVHQNMIPAM